MPVGGGRGLGREPMNEHRSTTSEGIWIWLCILRLLVTAAAGAFSYMEYRRGVVAQ